MADSTAPDPTVSEELLTELHRRLEAHRASPEESQAWEIVDKIIFGED
jgi:putative addiction module component (TIGR02574 family)